MKIKGLVDEDVVNYKKTSMYIIFPYCFGFKCGAQCCQNSALAQEKNIDCDIDEIIIRYNDNPLTEAIVMGGLEPFDSFSDLLWFVVKFRYDNKTDDIVIYTGYNEDEIASEIDELREYPNIIVKFGRFVPGQKPHYDEVLGVELASDNQYARRIS